eukprot:gene10721-10877_t
MGVSRWEVPESLLPRPQAVPVPAADALYRVLLPFKGDAFSLVVTRTGDSGSGTQLPAVFRSKGSSLVFKDQYLELGTAVPSDASLYGLGQRTNPDGGINLPRDGSKVVLWNYDIPSATRDVNLYGSHPFYMQVNKGGVVIGGLLDLYIFMGPHPEAVIQQYQEVVGRPAMPPYWSLGFHSCRFVNSH